jgi:hypothetical protein
VAWSFIEAIAGSSCVAKIAVLLAKVAAVLLSDVRRSPVWIKYRTSPKTLSQKLTLTPRINRRQSCCRTM